MLTHILYVLLTTHITIAFVTIYLHRAQSHRSLKVSPVLDKVCRLWLWFFTGQVTTEWVAVHRKHHAKCETAEDPHSPRQKGLWTVLLKGVWLYKQEAKNPETLAKYTLGCPKDKLEAWFMKYSWAGLIALLALDVALFSYHGLWIYLVQILWIPFWAAGVVNGVGHFFGYRTFETKDASTNMSPWGIIIGGEELHNNHHAYPTSAKLSMRSFEFDIGWVYIKMFEKLGLVSDIKVSQIPVAEPLSVKPLSPQGQPIVLAADKQVLSFFQHQYYYKKLFDKSLKSVIKNEIALIQEKLKNVGVSYSKRKLYKIFHTQQSNLCHTQKESLSHMLAHSERLQQIYALKSQLLQLWENKKLQLEEAKKHLREWLEAAHVHYQYELHSFFHKSQLKAV